MSPISIEPNKGVRLQLANYTKTRSFQGGGEFWETQFQQIIRQCLGECLPRAQQDQPGSVLFQYFVGAEEVCSKSEPIDGHIPAGELQRIERCIEALKAKESDPHTDGNARHMIQAFKLPDPAKDPELYRVYGAKTSRKLLVLWGVEKESLSSLDPMTAVSRVRERSPRGMNLQWLWGLLALLLLLLIGWVVYKWSKSNRQSDTVTVLPPNSNAVAVVVRGDGNPAAPSQTNTPSSPNSANAGAAGVHPPISNPSEPKPKSEKPSSPASNGSPVSGPTPPAPVEQITKLATNVAPAAPPRSQGPTPIPKPSPDPSARTATSNGAPNPPREPPIVPPPPGSKATPMPPVAPKAPGIDTVSPTPLPDPKPPINTPPTPAAPTAPAVPQPKLTITFSASGDETAPDGKVKVELKASLLDSAGRTAKLSKVTEWKIDGLVQFEPDGKKTITTSLTAQLPKGPHRVDVIGSAEGEELLGNTDIEVVIKSTGTVRQKEAK